MRRSDGQKELIAVVDGYRESEQSWDELLLDLKQRGLRWHPSWPSAMGRWDSGRRCERSMAKRVSSVAGSTRRPTSSTTCPRACSRKPRPTCTRSGWPRRASGRQGVRRLPGKISGEIRRCLRVSLERPRGADDVLRLPGRTLEAPANDESDRVDVRDDPTTPPPYEGKWHTTDKLGHDVQAGSVGRNAGDDSTAPNKSIISSTERIFIDGLLQDAA